MATAPGATSSPFGKLLVTLAALSSTSIVHLRSAQIKTKARTFKEITPGTNQFDQDGDHEMQDLDEEDRVETLTEFTLFPKLPPEMQDEIWKCCVPLQPRTVELQSYLLPQSVAKNQAVVLSQVNQKTRQQTYALHGYVHLRHKKFNKTVVFNPKVDILYLAHKTLVDDEWNKEKVMKCLERAGALDKIRCVALHCKKGQVEKWAPLLQQFHSVELLFLVVEQVYPLDPVTHAYLQPNFKFEDIELHEESKQRWGKELGSLEQYRKSVQGSMARGSERVAPHVVLVKEVWNLPAGCHFWTASMSQGN